MSGEMNQWIWDTMFSMTLLMVLVLIIRKPVSHFFGARIAYLLWTLPLARLFMPTLTIEAPAAVAPAATYTPAMVGSDLVAMAPVQETTFSAFASLDWMMIAMILWLGGAGLLFISKLAAYMQFREDIVADGCLVGRHDNIRILETAAVGGPLAFGIFEKYIAVPTNFFRDYAPRERELALEHEIAHHESGDLVANFVGLILLSLHWFSPVAWYAWIAFREDQETACDARILERGGREVRAVYGRTIAKSVSGHRLGLASPLNQKDKIKGRLKMLHQNEKSGIRRKIGMLMVGASALVAMPLTATVVYAEADVADPDLNLRNSEGLASDASDIRITVDEKGKEKKIIKIGKAGSGGDGKSLIEVESGDGDYVRTFKKDGRTIIIRTSQPISDAEFKKMIVEAEQSRLEADAQLRRDEEEAREQELETRQHELEMRVERQEADRERQEADRERQEVRQEVLVALQDAAEARREALLEANEARQEALAEAREARLEALQAVREAQSDAERNARTTATALSSISYSTSNKVNGPDCVAMNRQIAMNGENGLVGQAWAVVAGCGGFEVKVDKAAILKQALVGLEKGRAEAVKCKDGKSDRAKKIKDFDRSIKKVKAQLAMT